MRFFSRFSSFTLLETSPLSKTVLLTSPSVAIYHLLCTEQSHHQSGFLPQGKHGIALPLEHLEHFLIQTTRLQATRDWYVDVLGMTEGWHPDFKFPVVWLYLGDKDVLHLTEGGPIVSQNRLRYLGQQSTQTQGTGVVDHVAFRCSDLPGMLQHLRERNIAFNERMVSEQGLYQLFLFDPNGVKVELNFANEEAIRHGINAPVKASEL